MQKKDNQDPASYSKTYFLNECAGASAFMSGEEHSVFEYIFEISGDVTNKMVLDVGCGRGEVIISALRRGASHAVGLDFSKDAIEIARTNAKNSCIDFNLLTLIHGDALTYRFDQQFDLIFLADVVEHLFEEQLILLLENLKLALRPNGRIIIHTMPTREFIYFGQYVKWIYCLLKRKKFHRLSFASQAALTHVNLQSKGRLAKLLSNFNCRIWYDFADRRPAKKFLKKLGLARLISSNLWAEIRH